MRFLLIASLAESLINFRGPLIAALQAKGFEVHVAAPDMPADGLVGQKLNSMGVHLHEIPLQRAGMGLLADLNSLRYLWLVMKDVCPSHVMCYTIKPVVYGSLAAWFAGVPHRFALITGLGYAFQGDGQRSFLKAIVQRLYAVALARVERVFFQNPDDKALFCELGILDARVPVSIVNGSGVDVSSFSVSPSPEGPLRFLLIGRLLGDKGVREYALAARRIKKLHSDVRFSLVGWIDENPNSISAAELEAWQADGCIEYLGRLADVRPAIADCSVYVLPSYREGTPRTVLEAMAMGRPIITTDAPGCRETVVDGENGFLVAVKSVDALEQAMLKFIETPGLIARMGVSSRRIAERKYDVHRVNDFMIAEMGCIPK